MQPEDAVHDLRRLVSNVTLVIIVARRWSSPCSPTSSINRTKFGRGIRAVAQDPTTATLMGVSRERIIMMTFLIGGLLAGAAALLYTLKVPQGIIYSGGFLLGIKAFSRRGARRHRQPARRAARRPDPRRHGELRAGLFGTQWRDVVAFVLLVLVLLFRPTGILGESLGKARA